MILKDIFYQQIEQIVAIDYMIHNMLMINNPDDDINRKFGIVKELRNIKNKFQNKV